MPDTTIVTPSWRSLVLIMLDVYVNATKYDDTEVLRDLIEEFQTMAQAADIGVKCQNAHNANA